MGPRTLVSPGNDAADELARRGALLAPSAIPCSLSPLISRIHSRLFSDWRRTVSSKYFDPQVPSISTEELGLPRHARCVLSHLRYNGHSLLLGSYLSRIGRIENFFCSACGHSSQDTFHLILHCPATVGYASMPPTRCQANSMSSQFDAKPTRCQANSMPKYIVKFSNSCLLVVY